ncbi:hypothetical protein [Truepera radiovictrix]|uniref:Uncharacterized protein n=1 Tax=Truepera radiovictrix (strain DSM 17093 / CIP 108686 / LMG 22925 / RQ-24) TaxID=649638 RepID=D7CUS1_TRURR|nr:hypothetical protein [Truepera radiovictrix]ADI14062.1 hypothetical protein Trad_0930 [Truepera radiovictrix DSM 17093]WMT57376.1 hypothetical protein RCV51_00165 [Truepera radiovictrix]
MHHPDHLEPTPGIVPPHEPDDDSITPVEDPRKPAPLPGTWDEEVFEELPDGEQPVTPS